MYCTTYRQSPWTCTILAWKSTPLSQSQLRFSHKKCCNWLRGVHFHAKIVHVQGLWRYKINKIVSSISCLLTYVTQVIGHQTTDVRVVAKTVDLSLLVPITQLKYDVCFMCLYHVFISILYHIYLTAQL